MHMNTNTHIVFGKIASSSLPCLNIFTLGLNSLCDSYVPMDIQRYSQVLQYFLQHAVGDVAQR